MTLYLVKWQDGSSALIQAEDDDHLGYLLDELADPAAASWQVYDGPLWLEFPKMERALPEEGGVHPSQLELGPAEVAETDWGYDFEQEMLRLLHPTVAALRDRSDDEQKLDRAEVLGAIESDLGFGLAGSIFGGPDGPPQ